MTSLDALRGQPPSPALGTATRGRAPEGRKFYYGDTTLIGVFDAGVADLDRSRPTPYGLAPLWQATYGALRGESGNYYMPVRFNHVSMTPRLHLPVTPLGGLSADAPEALRSFYGYTTNDVVGDRWLLSSRGKPDRGFSLDVEPGKVARWVENGILDLTMVQTGSAMQMYHPDPEHDWYYLATVCEISGHVLGDPVVGAGGWELAWSNGSLDWRELPVPRRCEDIWMIYVTHYADGGVEGAALYANAQGTGVGKLTTDGTSAALRGLRSEVDLDADRTPARVRWSDGARTWEWTAENPASLTSPRNPSYIWMFGSCRELGSDREIVSSYGYAEVLPRVVGRDETEGPA
ncbi:hypothetical protein SAMN05443668_106425 [Cryptosporangium aurantiacum]|uniref:Uncharacterized protein n=1 Tax=Cryptosporangium aurantiacum TaxID=134849 RepID=A0A1M7R4T0_9ACTN|nr:hypothetical protein SAMN05443668_106425 [Cryptosporangium aurantiacum]